jgi:hypothetical protein
LSAVNGDRASRGGQAISQALTRDVAFFYMAIARAFLMFLNG